MSSDSFKTVFESLCTSHSPWQVFQDFVEMCAISINVSAGIDKSKAAERERHYMNAAKSYNQKELSGIAQLFAITIQELEENPCQDFLGDLFMKLGLGDCWKGQFFTPYHICEMMARLDFHDGSEALQTAIRERGYVSATDCACGAGATLIAARNALNGLVPGTQCLFVAQDLSRTACYMSYIQLALLGCCGYVVNGDTLKNPFMMHGWLPVESEYYDVWTLPMTARFMPVFSTVIGGTNELD